MNVNVAMNKKMNDNSELYATHLDINLYESLVMFYMSYKLNIEKNLKTPTQNVVS